VEFDEIGLSGCAVLCNPVAYKSINDAPPDTCLNALAIL